MMRMRNADEISSASALRGLPFIYSVINSSEGSRPSAAFVTQEITKGGKATCKEG